MFFGVKLKFYFNIRIFCNRTSAVNNTGVGWYTFIDLEFFGNKHKDVEVFYNEVAGDMLIGRNILDEYSVTFDGMNSKLYIE